MEDSDVDPFRRLELRALGIDPDGKSGKEKKSKKDKKEKSGKKNTSDKLIDSDADHKTYIKTTLEEQKQGAINQSSCILMQQKVQAAVNPSSDLNTKNIPNSAATIYQSDSNSKTPADQPFIPLTHLPRPLNLTEQQLESYGLNFHDAVNIRQIQRQEDKLNDKKNQEAVDLTKRMEEINDDDDDSDNVYRDDGIDYVTESNFRKNVEKVLFEEIREGHVIADPNDLDTVTATTRLETSKLTGTTRVINTVTDNHDNDNDIPERGRLNSPRMRDSGWDNARALQREKKETIMEHRNSFQNHRRTVNTSQRSPSSPEGSRSRSLKRRELVRKSRLSRSKSRSNSRVRQRSRSRSKSR